MSQHSSTSQSCATFNQPPSPHMMSCTQVNNAGRAPSALSLFTPAPAIIPTEPPQLFPNYEELVQSHCAGRNIRKPMVDYTTEDFHALFSTNLESAFALTQVALQCARLSRVDSTPDWQQCMVMHASRSLICHSWVLLAAGLPTAQGVRPRQHRHELLGAVLALRPRPLHGVLHLRAYHQGGQIPVGSYTESTQAESGNTVGGWRAYGHQDWSTVCHEQGSNEPADTQCRM